MRTNPTSVTLFYRKASTAFLACWLVATGVTAQADTPRVTCTGGADETGRHYTWVVVNNHDAPLVGCVFPHYNAAGFTPPDGWEVDISHMFPPGGKTGTCTGHARNTADGMAPGASGTFVMRVGGPVAAPQGTATVTFTFADGTKTMVEAEVPVPESLGAKNMPLIGLCVVVLIFLIIRHLRKGQTPQIAESDDPDGET